MPPHRTSPSEYGLHVARSAVTQFPKLCRSVCMYFKLRQPAERAASSLAKLIPALFGFLVGLLGVQNVAQVLVNVYFVTLPQLGAATVTDEHSAGTPLFQCVFGLVCLIYLATIGCLVPQVVRLTNLNGPGIFFMVSAFLWNCLAATLFMFLVGRMTKSPTTIFTIALLHACNRNVKTLKKLMRRPNAIEWQRSKVIFRTTLVYGQIGKLLFHSGYYQTILLTIQNLYEQGARSKVETPLLSTICRLVFLLTLSTFVVTNFFFRTVLKKQVSRKILITLSVAIVMQLPFFLGMTSDEGFFSWSPPLLVIGLSWVHERVYALVLQYFRKRKHTGPILTRKSVANPYIASSTCCICFLNKADCVFMPCKHQALCQECSTAHLKFLQKCVYCRSRSEAIYLPPRSKFWERLKDVYFAALKKIKS